MSPINFLTALVSFLFIITVNSAAVFYRDNTCTACLATIEEAVKVPAILDPAVPDDTKKTIMNEQVCAQLGQTPLYGFCQGFTEAWSPALYHFLIENSQDPTVVCQQPQFKAC